MDNELCKREDTVSVLQVDELFLKRVLGRASSHGRSSRLSHKGSACQVPFQWEMMPGIPKVPQKKETVPPIRPPPASPRLNLPAPRVAAKAWRVNRFLKKIKARSRRHNGNVGMDDSKRSNSSNNHKDHVHLDASTSDSSSNSSKMFFPSSNANHHSSSPSKFQSLARVFGKWVF